MNQLKLGDTIAYDKEMIAYRLTTFDFRRFVGKLVLMDDEAVGAEKPSWLEVVQIERFNNNSGLTIKTAEGTQTIPKRKLVQNAGNYVAFYAVKEVSAETVPETAVVVSEEYTKAVTLTRHIIAEAQAMQASLYEVCKGLKEMRDGKLYKELGYQNFEDYCVNEIKITYRQAKKYVAIATGFSELEGSRLPSVGTEKLYLLSMLEEVDRQALTERIDPSETSVKELKAEIQKLKSEKEQAQKRIEELESKPIEHYSQSVEELKEIERLTAENNQLKIENEALEEQRDELEGKIFTMENDCQEGAVSDAEEKRFAEFSSTMNQQLVEETHRIHEEAQEEISRANLQRDNAYLEVEKLKKQLAEQKEDSPEMKRFKVRIATLCDSIEQLVKFLCEHTDSAFLDKSETVIKGAETSLDEIRKQVQG